MQFSMKEWRRMYDIIQQLGITLKDSRPTYDESGNYFPPKYPLSANSQSILESKISSLCQRSNKYLDQTGMKPKKRLWYYNRKDTTTHQSSPDFAYAHLLEVEE